MYNICTILLNPLQCPLRGVALGATAFAALRKEKVKPSLKAFENELGVQPPLGFWDPAGLSADGDAREFYRRRVVEIKHGRMAMLACTGYIVQQFVRFPGFLSPSSDLQFSDVPNGLAATTKARKRAMNAS